MHACTTGGGFAHEREIGFPQGIDGLKSRDGLSSLTPPISGQWCGGEFASSINLDEVWEVMGMAFVIAEPYTDVMDQACLQACPVACIHFQAGKDRKLYIDPAECIDCGACKPVCPVKAIFADYELPTPWRAYADIDALWYRDKAAARARVVAMQDGN
jgi:NAD-dependent dihydropyrimidine dehydrogenase PreA subunit